MNYAMDCEMGRKCKWKWMIYWVRDWGVQDLFDLE